MHKLVYRSWCCNRQGMFVISIANTVQTLCGCQLQAGIPSHAYSQVGVDVAVSFADIS